MAQLSGEANGLAEPSAAPAGNGTAAGTAHGHGSFHLAADEARRKALTARFFHSARGFWRKDGDKAAWLLTGLLVFLILANLAAQYGLNRWNRVIFDAIEKRDGGTILTMTYLFPILAVGTVLIGVFSVWARMTMQRRWRAWLAHHETTRWLSNGRYFQLNLVQGDHTNPEYRISDDLRLATDAPVDFLVGILQAMLSALTFITVLWSIGGAISISIGGERFDIPGFLVIAAIIYALVTSVTMSWIGRDFVKVSERKNQVEAEYRYALTRVRENGESISLLGGEEEERSGINSAFGRVLREWKSLCVQHMRTTIVSQGSSVIAPVVPVLLCAPKFLDGSMSLGEVMQAASAFTIVQTAFGWLVDNYPRMADWNASARRTASLMVSLDSLEEADGGLGRIQHGETRGGPILNLKGLSVTLDDGSAVVQDAEVEIHPGERVLIAGESGSGKSTLVRAIAGLWPWGEGEITRHEDRRIFMLPQRAYIPTGSLRRAVTYPGGPQDWDTDQVREALALVGLGHLADRLETEEPWDQILSGGEKQRLAFARLILHNPDIVVLDEATSALDGESQNRLMQLIIEKMPKLTIVSVAHRPELEQFHGRKIVLKREEDGAKIVSDKSLRPLFQRATHAWWRIWPGD